MKKSEEKIRYQVFALRLDERTKKKLIEGRTQSGLSWNKYILTLIDKDYKNKLKEIK